MAEPKKTVMMNVRMDPQHRRLIKNAARVRGTTVADLVRDTMIPKAKRIVLAQDEEEQEEAA